jgi:hypothetical protein
MFGGLNYNERKAERRKFRKKLETFVKKGEQLAKSSNDLQVLIVIHSTELNQIVDYCNCNATDLIRQYQLSIKSACEDDFSAKLGRPPPLSIPDLVSDIGRQKRQTQAEEIGKAKKAKVSASQLSSTGADTATSRSRSPTYRPCSPSSLWSTSDFGDFEWTEIRRQPILVETSAVPSGFSPHKKESVANIWIGTNLTQIPEQ